MSKEFQKIVGIMGVTAGLFIESGCTAPVLIDPHQMPPATATAIAERCIRYGVELKNMTDFSPVYLCAIEANPDIAQRAILKRLATSKYLDPKHTPFLLEPLSMLESLDQNGSVSYFEWRFDGAHGEANYGCTWTLAFRGVMVLPKMGNAEPNAPDRALGTRWHEQYHMAQAYERYQQHYPCPLKLPDNLHDKEERLAEYGGELITSLARLEGFQPTSKEKNINELGHDLPDIIYFAFIPNDIGPEDGLNIIMGEELFQRWLGIHNYAPDKRPKDIQKSIDDAEERWNKFIRTATPAQFKALQEIQVKGLVNPSYFPQIPK